MSCGSRLIRVPVRATSRTSPLTTGVRQCRRRLRKTMTQILRPASPLTAPTAASRESSSAAIRQRSARPAPDDRDRGGGRRERFVERSRFVIAICIVHAGLHSEGNVAVLKSRVRERLDRAGRC